MVVCICFHVLKFNFTQIVIILFSLTKTNIYINNSCHSKFECNGYETSSYDCNNLLIENVKCENSAAGGIVCSEKSCSDFCGTVNDENCLLYQSYCSFDSINSACHVVTSCNTYPSEYLCKDGKTFNHQYCEWIGDTCQIQSCSSLTSKCLYFNTQCIQDGNSCVDLVSCTQILSEANCYIAYNISNLKCLWIHSSCQDYFNCKQLFTEYECLRYDLCRLSITGCEYKEQLCIWSNPSCEDKRKCKFQNNQIDCEINSSCFWNSTCQDKQCSMATTETDCKQVQLLNGNKCLWVNNSCLDTYACSDIKNPQSYEDCKSQHSNCTIQYVFSDKQHYCQIKSFSCDQITNFYQCITDIHNNKCIWDLNTSTCLYNQCEQYKNDNGYNNLICAQFNNLCVVDSTNTGCRTSLDNCNQYLSSSECKYALTSVNTYCIRIDNACINAACSNYSLVQQPKVTCQQYAKCSVIGGICMDRLANCNLYNDQAECLESYDSSNNKCMWINTSCEAKTCSNYQGTIFSHSGCNSWLSTCTASAQLSSCVIIIDCQTAPLEINTILKCEAFPSPNNQICTIGQQIGVCQNLPSSCNFAMFSQCFIDADRNACYWSYQYSICKQLTCSNIDTTVTSAAECESLLRECTINSQGFGCQIKSNCQHYSNTQCQLKGIKNQNQIMCIYGCQKRVCEDYSYQTDASCRSILEGSCRTDGTKCITTVTCSDFYSESQCQISTEGKTCYWLKNVNICIERKCSYATHDIYYSHILCQNFMNTCTYSIKAKNCVEIDSCNKLDNNESCQVDKEGSHCIWNDSQCSEADCFNICGDGLVNFPNELCDDGNILPNDGCYLCQYSCVIGCSICQQGICLACDYNIGYYLDQNNDCIAYCGDGMIQGKEECDDQNEDQFDGCYNCKYQCHFACIECFQGLCGKCEYGWEISNSNQCELLCGDGIIGISNNILLSEQCDDGNIDSYDGCTSACEVESGWVCRNDDQSPSKCNYFKQPTMLLSLITTAPKYIQQASITFSEKLRSNQALQSNEILAFIIFLDPKLYDIKIFGYQQSSELIDVEYLINIEFKSSIENPRLFVKLDSSSLINEHDQSPSLIEQSIRMFSTYIESSSEKFISYSTTLLNKILLYIIFTIAIISIFLGNQDIFWNFLDIAQYLSYFSFINVQFSNNLSSYFDLFNVISLQPFYNFMHLSTFYQLILKNEVIIIETTNKFSLANVSALYIQIFIKLMINFIFLFLTFYINNHMIKLVFRNMKLFFERFRTLKVITILIKNQIRYQNYFYYSGIIRLIFANSYEIMFSIFLQLCYLDFSNGIKIFSVWLSILTSITMIIAIFTISKQVSSSIRNYKFRILFEEINFNSCQWTRQFQTILLFKKISFMFLLLFSQQSGVSQTALISMTHLIFILYVIGKKPLVNQFEHYKIIFIEISIGLATSTFIFYEMPQFSIEEKYRFGWFHITIFSSILFFTFILDSTQQVKYLWLQMQSNSKVKQSKKKKAENNAIIERISVVFRTKKQ